MGGIADILCNKCYYFELTKNLKVLCHKTGRVFSRSCAPRRIDQCCFFEPVWNHKSFLFIERKYFKEWKP